MDFLRQQLAQINERLAGLSATQKMLVAALAVIVVMTLLYWGKNASTTEMVPLLPGAVTGQELANVTGALKSSGITYETSSTGQILVPAAKQGEALMTISSGDALSSQTVDMFANIVAQSTPWDSAGKWDATLNHYHESRFAKIIGRAPGIASAEVTITQPASVGIAHQPPAASVTIYTKPDSGVARRKMAQGAANVIATSLGIERSRVGITIDGVMFNSNDLTAGGTGGMDGSELFEQKRLWGQSYATQIREMFDDISGLRVTVNVQVDNETTQKTLNDVDPTHKVSGTIRSSSERSNSTEGAAAQQEPGVVSNIGASISARSASAPAGTSTEKTEEQNLFDYGRSTTITARPPGSATPIAAGIRVPNTYFVNRWKQSRPDGGAASGTEFNTFVSDELEEMRTAVKKLTAITDDNAVTATISYPEPIPTDDAIAAGGPMLAAADAGGIKVFATGHAKDVAVGVLALASLFMVGRMVKRTAPPAPEPILALDNDATPLGARTAATSGAVAAKVRSAAAVGTLRGAEDVAGDVIESGPVMMGQELDEAVLETSQMVDQVGGFVKDNPEMAAQLLSRWMARE